MVKILRKSYENHKAQFPKLSVFVGQELIFRHDYIQDIKDGIQIINKERVTHFGQLISVKVKTILRKSQVQFQKKFRKFRLRHNDGFLIRKT